MPEMGVTDESRRFAFGRNWRRYLEQVSEARIEAARQSLMDMLGVATLEGRRFLDVGCGSGLFSLAARQLGAEVTSFDLDEDSVACARSLRERYFPDAGGWRIEQGSMLDGPWMRALGEFDVVYAWGVVHHTGQMWRAFDHVAASVAPGGALFTAIYNDQGLLSRYWTAVKRLYNRGPAWRALLVAVYAPVYVGLRMLVRMARGRGGLDRGMTYWYDTLDWLGGYPFEVARPGEVLEAGRRHGFILERLVTCGGRHGCNEFVFRRPAAR